MPARQGETLVPSRLPVVMDVDTDKARCDQQAAGVENRLIRLRVSSSATSGDVNGGRIPGQRGGVKAGQ